MNTKIIVVDMVNGFIKEGALHDEGIMDIVPNIQTLIEKRQDAKVIVFEDCHKEDCAEFLTFPPHCIEGTSEAKTIDELAYLLNKDTNPNLEAVIQKNSTNGFFRLQEAGLINDADEFIIVGCCTDICVAQLALALRVYANDIDKQLKVTVLKDCVSTYDAPYHPKAEYEECAFKMMALAGVECVELNDVI